MFLLSVGACSFSIVDKDIVPPAFMRWDDYKLYVNVDEINLLRNSLGNPISTEIIEDESLGTVHTFDLLPVIVSEPVLGDDGLWRLQTWISSGKSIEDSGYVVTMILGYDDTVIEYDLLNDYVFEYKSGNTESIANIVSKLKPADQIFVHVIGEHSFTAKDIVAITDLGFDYARLVKGYEDQNMAILDALLAGDEPPGGQIRGVGLIYRGTRAE